MGEDSKQLEQLRIERARADLDRDLDVLHNKVDTLQTKVRQSLDWRYQFEERPLLMMGIAFGAGALLSMVRSHSR